MQPPSAYPVNSRPVATNTTPTNTPPVAGPTTFTNPYELMQRSVAGPTAVQPTFTGTNPYELVQQSLAGGGNTTVVEKKEDLKEVTEGTDDPTPQQRCEDNGGRFINGKCYYPGETGGSGGGVPGADGVVTAAPKDGDVRRGENNQIEEFRNGVWQVAAGSGSTREYTRIDPASVAAETQEEVAGADANVPPDQYLKSLGTDTLAGQAYQRALALRMASIDEQQRTAGLSYGDMYEQAKMSQAARRGLSDVSGMTGGMADQAQSRRSAAEIASLGQIGMGREATMRQLEMAELNAPMEAFQEGAQMDQFERARQMQDTQVQQAQTLFEQAQSGWVQNEDGTWTNIDKQTQDALSLQAVNATQRAEVLGEIQYWQAVLADSNQASLHEAARENISTLQTRYGELLANNSVLTGGPSGTTPPGPGPGPGPGPEPEPEPEPEPAWKTDFTGGTLEQNATTFIATKLPTVGLSATDDLPGFRPGIRTDNDLAQSIYNLAGNKAVEGYDFATEIALVNKAAKNSDTLTSAEFDQLKAAGIYGLTQQYHKLFDIRIPTNTGDLRGQTVNFPQNDLMKSFMVYLVNTGMLTENEVASSLRNNAYNISALGSNQQPRFPQILDEFSKWNETGRPTRKPTTYTGGSAPENPKEGDMWQTPYGKATFKDGRWQ
jgi:hypothetical protein